MPKLSELLQSVATGKNDLLSRLYLGLLMPKDEILKEYSGIKGLEIYSEIERDAHAFSVLHKRKCAPLSHPVEYEPASTKRIDKKAAELVKDVMERTLDHLWIGLGDSILKGFSVSEVLWGVVDGMFLPVEFKLVDQRRFCFMENENKRGGWELRLLTQEAPLTGIEVPARKFIVHTSGSKDGSPYGIGLGQKLYWPAFFKRTLSRYWLQHTERFASPTIAGAYPSGFTKEEVDDFMNRLEDAGRRGAMAFPEGMDVKALLQASSGDAYERAIRYWDEETSKAVLGETLTTTMGNVGSYAASQTHNEVRLELASSDSDLLCATLTPTVVAWIVELNCPGAKPPRMVRKITQPANLKAEAEKDQILTGIGYKPSPTRIENVYGPDYIEVAPPAPATEPSLSPIEGLNGATGTNDAPNFAEGGDAALIARQVNRAMGQANLSGVMDPIRKIVKEAKSLEGLRDTLDHAYPSLDAEGFAEVMAQAFQVAAVMGRYDVLQERAGK